MHDEIVKIIVNRDGLEVDAAVDLVDDVQDKIDQLIASSNINSNSNINNNDVDVERKLFADHMDLLEEIADIVKNELGLEPDYADCFFM